MELTNFLPFFEWKNRIINSEHSYIKSNKKITYLNEPCSFDIETSSYYNQNGEKRACAYAFMIGVNKCYYLARTYNDLLNAFSFISKHFSDHKVIIYVHNLAYEFQFIRKWVDVKKCFAIKERKPLYFEFDNLIFKCSYLLSGLSLENIGKQIGVEKQTGKLDYRKIRHSNTPLTYGEKLYCLYDLKVVDTYIETQIKEFNGICYIPYTKTGKVRKHIKLQCFYGGKKSHRKNCNKYFKIFRRKMEGLTLTVECYEQLKKAFQGGFTHSNPFNTNVNMHKVTSYDLTSAYPAVMFRYKFPMSAPFKKVCKSEKEFRECLNEYCCVFTIQYNQLDIKRIVDFPISESKCVITGKRILSNGRVVSAEQCVTTITEQDFKVIERFYNYDSFKVCDMYCFKKGYLPYEFINAMLDLYQKKTELKGVSDREDYYLNIKEMLNSFFGMCVTDISREQNTYENGEWTVKCGDVKKDIDKYNNDRMRYLYYAWGVWITAHNRRVLFQAIDHLGEDYVYADTDSVKFLNGDKHKTFFDEYNAEIIRFNNDLCDLLGYDRDKLNPTTIKGVKKPLGVWENEGTYDIFKTLGAKRYMVLKDGELSFTVSGCSKKTAIPYLIEKYGKYGALSVFTDDMYIPSSHTSKMTHTYIDEDFTESLTDYLGNTMEVHEKSYIHLEPCEFSLSISNEFVKYINGIRTEVDMV